jgi:large subunit ribosomal protein L3
VFKGKKMAGHMGASRVTTQGLEIVKIDPENNLILLRGAVPGASGGDVVLLPSVKGGKKTSS